MNPEHSPKILVDIQPTRQGGNLSPRDLEQDLTSRIDDITASINTISDRMQSGLVLDAGPTDWGLDSVTVKLGIELAAESGVVFARAGAKAMFEVTLTWTR